MGSSLTKFLTSLWFTNRNLRVVVLGLDAAGKTTALYRMHLGEVVHTIPTIGFNVETIKLHNCTITAWDVGGQSRVCLPSSSLISFASQYYNTNQQYQFVSLTDSLAHTRISLLSALSALDLSPIIIIISLPSPMICTTDSTTVASLLSRHTRHHLRCGFIRLRSSRRGSG
jgi:GTPase SAR1 family protein